jgi:site-specific DNA recombinase
MTLRVAPYARYSTDLQREASIDDQLRLCQDYASRQGWIVAGCYHDRAISGASLLRPGLQELMSDAARKRFDIVLAESLDRLSRDQEDIAGLFKRLSFLGIRMFTVAEGEIGEMHIGLKGMNALFLKDLRLKTHRGLQGRIEAAKSAGGNSYGYAVVRGFAADGSVSAGDREIKADEVDIVRRIFQEFAAGKSPRAIAHTLNKEQVPGPRGEGWGQSTINGNPERGTGILNNELYIGRLVWNRLRYVKDPSTGKRVSRLNPPESWVIREVPHLRIIDDELWQAVKAQQHRASKKSARQTANNAAEDQAIGFWSHQRPRYLLSGLMRCGACGGGYTKISANLFGCAAARNKGTCDNRLNIRTDALENIVCTGLKERLFKEFAAAFITEGNTIIAQQNAHFAAAKTELVRVKARQKTLLQALGDGVPARLVKDEMIALEAREDELTALLADQPAAEPALHPNLAEIYRVKVAELHLALSDPQTKDEAFAIIRTLIDEVRLIP